MAIDQNSVAGDVAISFEVIGGLKPYAVSVVGSPNDFAGFLDVAATDSDEIFDLVLNAAGVGNLPSDTLTGQVTIMDALRRSVTFSAFSVPLGPVSIVTLPISVTPITGSFFDNAALNTVVIQLGTINATFPVTWSIASGFDNGTGNALVTMQPDGSMTLNAAGVTYYGAHPGDGTLTGFVQVTDANGLSPPSPTQITLTVVAHFTLAVASISMVHAIA